MNLLEYICLERTQPFGYLDMYTLYKILSNNRLKLIKNIQLELSLETLHATLLTLQQTI
jgi:hypothetical protein